MRVVICKFFSGQKKSLLRRCRPFWPHLEAIRLRDHKARLRLYLHMFRLGGHVLLGNVTVVYIVVYSIARILTQQLSSTTGLNIPMQRSKIRQWIITRLISATGTIALPVTEKQSPAAGPLTRTPREDRTVTFDRLSCESSLRVITTQESVMLVKKVKVMVEGKAQNQTTTYPRGKIQPRSNASEGVLHV